MNLKKTEIVRDAMMATDRAFYAGKYGKPYEDNPLPIGFNATISGMRDFFSSASQVQEMVAV